jgi:hypothetical protein
MAMCKQTSRGEGPQTNAGDSVFDDALAVDPEDFELDEMLRSLRLDQWFAMVEEGMPLWVL